MICLYNLRLFTVPYYFVIWSGSNVNYACSLKKNLMAFCFCDFFLSFNILQDLLLLYDFSILSNLIPITLVKQLIQKWILRFHFLHEIEFEFEFEFF